MCKFFKFNQKPAQTILLALGLIVGANTYAGIPTLDVAQVISNVQQLLQMMQQLKEWEIQLRNVKNIDGGMWADISKLQNEIKRRQQELKHIKAYIGDIDKFKDYTKLEDWLKNPCFSDPNKPCSDADLKILSAQIKTAREADDAALANIYNLGATTTQNSASVYKQIEQQQQAANAAGGQKQAQDASNQLIATLAIEQAKANELKAAELQRQAIQERQQKEMMTLITANNMRFNNQRKIVTPEFEPWN